MSARLLSMCDLGYLPQLLVLHRSLLDTTPDFRLSVLCMDDPSREFLESEQLPGVDTVALDELESSDPQLAAAGRERSWREYCWTATPAFCLHELERAPAGEVVTWLDADMIFFRDARLALEAIGDGSLLLVTHRYHRIYPGSAPAWYLDEHFGRFNGGTIGFRHDADGTAALRLWRERTLAWCYHRTEPGRFGNQLHLSDFTARFQGARVCDDPGVGLAPWNAGQYRVEPGADGPLVDGRPLVFAHLQSLRLHRAAGGGRLVPYPSNFLTVPNGGDPLKGRTDAHNQIPASLRELVWKPYIAQLSDAIRHVEQSEPRYAESLERVRLGEVAADLRMKLALNWSRVTTRPRWLLTRVTST